MMWSPTREDIPQESYFIGREGREKKNDEASLAQTWAKMDSSTSQTYPNDNAHPVPSKHDAYIH